MGILSKLFGNSSKDSEIDKFSLYVALGMSVSAIDGDESQEEANFSSGYLRAKGSHFSEDDWNKIILRAESIGHTLLDKLDKLSKTEKLDLLKYVLGMANADGKIDANELAYITMLAHYSGMMESLIQLSADYNINENTYKEAAENVKNILSGAAKNADKNR